MAKGEQLVTFSGLWEPSSRSSLFRACLVLYARLDCGELDEHLFQIDRQWRVRGDGVQRELTKTVDDVLAVEIGKVPIVAEFSGRL